MARTRTTRQTTKETPEETPKRQLSRRVPPLTVSRAFGSKSPLTDLDLQAFLAKCMSTNQWHTYTDQEKRRIFGSLPSSGKPAPIVPHVSSVEGKGSLQTQSPSHSAISASHEEQIETLSDPPVSSSDIAMDKFVKRAIARFKRDLGDGYYEKTWQDKARRAHEERMDGKFDEYLRQHAEGMFEDTVDEDDVDGKDELALTSEDGEYQDTAKGGKGERRPRKSQRGL